MTGIDARARPTGSPDAPNVTFAFGRHYSRMKKPADARRTDRKTAQASTRKPLGDEELRQIVGGMIDMDHLSGKAA